MAEYIDREAVYAEACRGCIRHGENIGECYSEEPCQKLIEVFATAPAFDVFPAAHKEISGEQIEKAILYFEDAVRESDEIITEHQCTEALKAELLKQKDHFVIALAVLREQEQSQWISVKDETPKRMKRYFIAYKFEGSDMRFYGEAMFHPEGGNGCVDRPHFSNEGVDGMYVTHWMKIPELPLLEPPKEGAEE